MKHEYHIEVRGYELDSFGHVNNAVYMNYLEAARWDLCKKIGLLDYNEEYSLFTIILETNIKYIRELKIFDKIVIKTDFEYEGDYLIFSHVIINENTNKKVAKAVSKLILVSSDRIIHDIPQLLKEKLDSGVHI